MSASALADITDASNDQQSVPIVDLDPPNAEQLAKVTKALARILVARTLRDLACTPTNDQ